MQVIFKVFSTNNPTLRGAVTAKERREVCTAAIICSLSSDKRETPASSLASTAVECSRPGYGEQASGAPTTSPPRLPLESLPQREFGWLGSGGARYEGGKLLQRWERESSEWFMNMKKTGTQTIIHKHTYTCIHTPGVTQGRCADWSSGGHCQNTALS